MSGFDDLYRLAADLDAVPAETVPNLKKALGVTSGKVKKAAQAKVRGRKHFKQAAAGIDYEVKSSLTGIEAEVGYDKDRNEPAKLGNLVEFGAPGSKNALTPGNELQRSLKENEADFLTGIEKAAGDALRKRGL